MVVGLICGGCVAEGDEEGDGEQDVFPDGKADGAIGGVDALRALRIANGLDLAALRGQVKLESRAAKNIVKRRSGADGALGTADDRPFYTLAELDAVSYVGPVALGKLVAFGAAKADVLDPALRVGALPPDVAADPNSAGLVAAIASEPSLAIDGDPSTMPSSEWELGLLYAHHFVAEQAPRIAALRPHLMGSDVRRGPFLDVGTLIRAWFGEGETGWMLAELLRRTAADPTHTTGRFYAPELEAALADADFVAQYPSSFVLEGEFLSVWRAQVDVTDPGDLPIDRARARALLASRGAPTFDRPYPADRPMPAALAGTAFPLPFAPGTEIVCMQGNNTMTQQASHGPDALRYALDLNALPLTPLVASAAGTAYVYDGGRPESFDNWGYGNILLIDLHNGYALFYAHLTTFAVANGQQVAAGQLVGTVGVTGAAGADAHVHLQVVPLFRTPDPATEKHHADVPGPGPATPFGGPEPFVLSALDITAGDTAPRAIPSTAFVGGEAGWLRGAAHVYRTP